MMNVVLTPELIGFLIKQGYKYCLLKTYEHAKAAINLTLILTPLRDKPCQHQLRTDDEAVLAIEREPAWLSEGAEDTLVMMKLDKDTLLAYVRFLTGPLKLWRANHE